MTEGEMDRVLPFVVEASYEGTCPACGDEIEEGDPIARDEDYDGWVHEDCYGG